MNLIKYKEPNLLCHVLKLVLGLAQITDGLITLLSLGFVYSHFGLCASGYLVQMRQKARKGGRK